MKMYFIEANIVLLYTIGIVASQTSVNFDVRSTFTFQTLQQKLKTTPKDIDCPFPYQRSGELCLFAADCSQKLSWGSARVFCQTYAGIRGDLVVFENACQFSDIITYINSKVGAAPSSTSCSLWAGASSNTLSTWNFVDGSVLPINGIYWGTPPTTASQYAFFDIAKAHYLNAQAGTVLTAPLCQFIPKKTDDDDDDRDS